MWIFLISNISATAESLTEKAADWIMANIEEDQVVPVMEEEQDPYPADDYCYEAELVRDFPILHEVSTKLHTFDCFLPPTT